MRVGFESIAIAHSRCTSALAFRTSASRRVAARPTLLYMTLLVGCASRRAILASSSHCFPLTFSSAVHHFASISPSSGLILSPVLKSRHASRMASTGVKRKSEGLGSADPAEAKKPKVNASITSFFGAPKPVAKPAANKAAAAEGDGGDGTAATPAAAARAPAKFDKEKWVATLSEEEKQLLSLEINTLHESWLAHLKDDIRKPSFLGLKRFLKREAEAKQTIYPPPEDVYSWSRHCPLDTVKVVILGQDPYHNQNQAHGLCFSVRPPVRAPPSLVNIYKAITNDYPDFKPPPDNGGLLTPWADRGVLLLNTCLTVRAHAANSHNGKGWEQFTKRVIDIVTAKRTRGVVFMAWGAAAKGNVVGVNKDRHHVLYSVHPSPLSASRGWFDCGHFKKANEWLQNRYGVEGVIDWSLDVSPEEAGV